VLEMTERPTVHRQQVSSIAQTPGSLSHWMRFKEFAAQNDFQLVVAFSLIGLLVALNLMFRFPDYGAIIAQYNQF
jgi:hypothetical protein